MKLQSKLRDIQDRSINRNWRIDFISWAEDNKPMLNRIENPMGILPLFGMLLFLAGFGYLIVHGGSVENLSVPISACIAGVSIAITGSILHEKMRKKKWVTVNAECLDYEIQFGRTPQNGHIWALRALCRFEFDGKQVLCTPEMTWSKRKGEEWKHHFISENETTGASCQLLFNPGNPKETEFLKKRA